MKKSREENSIESAIEENIGEKEFLMIQNTPFVKELAKRYRFRLVENYKEMIYSNWDEQINLDLTDLHMKEAVTIMNASDEEILKMYFEDAANKIADTTSEEYFNQVFEVSTQFP